MDFGVKLRPTGDGALRRPDESGARENVEEEVGYVVILSRLFPAIVITAALRKRLD